MLAHCWQIAYWGKYVCLSFKKIIIIIVFMQVSVHTPLGVCIRVYHLKIILIIIVFRQVSEDNFQELVLSFCLVEARFPLFSCSFLHWSDTECVNHTPGQKVTK